MVLRNKNFIITDYCLTSAGNQHLYCSTISIHPTHANSAYFLSIYEIPLIEPQSNEMGDFTNMVLAPTYLLALTEIVQDPHSSEAISPLRIFSSHTMFPLIMIFCKRSDSVMITFFCLRSKLYLPFEIEDAQDVYDV